MLAITVLRRLVKDTKIGHFTDALTSESLSMILKKLNLIQHGGSPAGRWTCN